MPANVWALGVTSLLTDVSSEMLASTLPLVFLLHLHASPAALAAADGVQQGAASLARLLGGLVSDRLRDYRRPAAAGYLLSAACRIGFLISTIPSQFVFFLSLDRVGKGFRTGPRDALLAQSAAPGEEARAFGLHRSLDTAGAMLGPLVGYWVLGLVPGDYSSVFLFSLGFAIVGVFVLLTCTSKPLASHVEPAAKVGDFVALLRHGSAQRLCLVAVLLGVSTLGDHVVYLALQRQHEFALIELPLLYIATPAACMCFSYPLGWLADRWSRTGVLASGYVVLVGAYAAAVAPVQAWCGVTLVVLLLGLFYAATDGVFMAIASRLLPQSTQAAGLSLLSTVNSLGRLTSALAFAALWSTTSDRGAMLIFSATAVACLLASLLVLSHTLNRCERSSHP
jgi:MFS family permease